MPTAMDHAPTLAKDSMMMDGFILKKAIGADVEFTEPLTFELCVLSHRAELMLSK